MFNLKALAIPALAALILSSGCSYFQATAQEEPQTAFGDTVRNVMNGQIHDFDAAINPNPDAVVGSDPNRLNNVVNAYREHISKPEEVRQPIEISVGGN